MAKISVIIPNYNGRQLLFKNLPNVIKNCADCEIIIVDDASGDDSVDFLQKNFRQIKVIQLAKNKGFAHAVNEGVRKANGDLVLLLNSDVSPQANFLPPALSHFKNESASQRIFAVGLADHSHENGKIVIRGRGGAIFKKGFVNHFALPSRSAETLWVSGGSGLFDKRKFLELGGFDTNFAPFYWEDIDLSFRAWRMGYRCLFEPMSKVNHFHQEGVIQKSRSEFFIKTISYKNQFLFVWKNITDPFWLLQHLFWLPYHLAKSMATFDLAFFAGFFWAIIQLPKLIFDYSLFTMHLDPQAQTRTASSAYSLSDREVLNKFAKS
ncbi:MAG: Glycosyl transferase, family 2 [Candidatus Curtissbacteria bacterium GW2011_GWC2_38_9]|uniref:Glycosyltransferase 2-like domain-containing protein n=3 Tax=Candidatus Curtissiibacteriota TaxID=1752717 RepID=A0A1F5HPP9_9BACT|nr:MAG: Glycosyl transferase, family 2 [Candidatus Curtissbacteria bacterium GW2011_GWC2_38_9]KKS04131.1 MAG: Glycosyl transferase, family 2 [Candidatus Curtissbacteria bacterium GW2011_GWA2_41_24]OGD88839.1 MAG: hypothetical protein A2Z54_01270 [Candidatus Curtissbacteria bacterium RIFCSPHIGHO2_02_39_8]OGE06138.1 MAG: hypothetical protein A2W70_05330 [Candidatus Curtissbacteria bacterium RIFCSPLOWO2_02_41_11]OGR14627.1 MAG: hypothetical protein A2097_08950 [Desulfobacula sp. GWF2_41_7]